MSEIVLQTDKPEKAALVLKETIELEKKRINHGLRVTRNRMEKFERKYNISSEKFIHEWSSEDLKDGDLEYVEWAGEYRMALNFKDRLDTLNSLKHVAS